MLKKSELRSLEPDLLATLITSPFPSKPYFQNIFSINIHWSIVLLINQMHHHSSLFLLELPTPLFRFSQTVRAYLEAPIQKDFQKEKKKRNNFFQKLKLIYRNSHLTSPKKRMGVRVSTNKLINIQTIFNFWGNLFHFICSYFLPIRFFI